MQLYGPGRSAPPRIGPGRSGPGCPGPGWAGLGCPGPGRARSDPADAGRGGPGRGRAGLARVAGSRRSRSASWAGAGSRRSRPGQAGLGLGELAPVPARPAGIGLGIALVPARPAGIGLTGIWPFPPPAAAVAPGRIAAARDLCGPGRGAATAVRSRPRGTRDRRPPGTGPACRVPDRAGTGRRGRDRDPARRNPATRPGARARNHADTPRHQGFAGAAEDPPQGRQRYGGRGSVSCLRGSVIWSQMLAVADQ